MAIKKRKRIILITGMSIFGWLYFLAFSSLEMNFLLRNYFAMLPFAVAFTLYLMLKKKG